MPKPSVDVVIPIFNEESCLPEMIRRLLELRSQNIDTYDIRAIFVDDGSSDESRKILEQSSDEFGWVSVLILSRNFGHQIAVTAGMDASKADFVAVIDGDLQDPPELIIDMLSQLSLNGDSIVYGQRIARDGESKFKIMTARFFYRAIRRYSNLEIPLDTGDFRVMTAIANKRITSLREHNRFLRGLAPWTGLKSSSFPYTRDGRYAGTTKYTLRKMIVLAFNAFVSFSVTPLRAIQGLGVALASSGVCALLLAAILAATQQSIPGYVYVILVNWVMTGVIVASIGVVGGYVHRIQDEVRDRPLYFLEKDE